MRLKVFISKWKKVVEQYQFTVSLASSIKYKLVNAKA